MPTENVTTLTENKWSNGNIPAGGAQWFKFTATATPQYLYIDEGTLGGVNIQMYDSTGSAVEGIKYITQSISGSWTVTINSVYYIKATAMGSNTTGTYQIGFTASTTPPPITLPTENVITLTENAWSDGNIPVGGVQWFKFTASAATQYIHFYPGGVTAMYVEAYDANGARVGNLVNLSGGYTPPQTVTSGSVYHIKATPSEGNGTYKMGFNASSTPPAITLPTANVTALTENKWSDGSLSAGGEQWFKFTATATPQYIHFYPGALASVNMEVYDSSGVRVGDKANFMTDTNSKIDRTVTSGSVYHIRVTTTWPGEAYKIGFTASTTAPTS